MGRREESLTESVFPLSIFASKGFNYHLRLSKAVWGFIRLNTSIAAQTFNLAHPKSIGGVDPGMSGDWFKCGYLVNVESFFPYSLPICYHITVYPLINHHLNPS